MYMDGNPRGNSIQCVVDVLVDLNIKINFVGKPLKELYNLAL